MVTWFAKHLAESSSYTQKLEIKENTAATHAWNLIRRAQYNQEYLEKNDFVGQAKPIELKINTSTPRRYPRSVTYHFF